MSTCADNFPNIECCNSAQGRPSQHKAHAKHANAFQNSSNSNLAAVGRESSRIQPESPEQFCARAWRASSSLGLGLWRTTADALGLGPLQMGGRNPAFIICLSSRSNRRPIRTDHSNLISRINLLRSTRRSLRTLATFAATLLLGKEGGDPGVVDEVDGATEGTEENKVQKDTRIAR